MAKLPTVAIIGKPNTGKSTLFNRLVGRRKAIVSDTPGTTRDQIAARVHTSGADFLLVDTGGMGAAQRIRTWKTTYIDNRSWRSRMPI